MRTILPEKWYIQTTSENVDILSKWRTDGQISERNLGGYLMYPGFNNKKGYNVPYIPSEGEEITFEEFKTLVLGEPYPEPNYEIY